MQLRERLREVAPDPDKTIVDLTFGPSVLAGTRDSDWIIAGDGADTIEAGDGDDFVSKSVGTGAVHGGAGRDTLYLRDVLTEIERDAIYSVDLLFGEASLFWAFEDSFEISLAGIENVAGSNGYDDLFGNWKANVLAGHAGDDILAGRKGDDALLGGGGSDDLVGGPGDDYLHGGRGSLDFLEGGHGNDTIDGGGGYDAALYWNAERIVASHVPGAKNEFIVTEGKWEDHLITVEEIWGSDGADLYRTGAGDTVIDAGAGRDTIFAGAGRDELYGGNGKDRMFGGAGQDTFFGGAGRDHMWGDGNAADATDHFFFDPAETGEVFRGRADVIHDFDDQDTIVITSHSDLEFHDGGRMPDRGMYTVFERGDAYVVRWREMSGSINDVVVRGDDDPTDNIDLVTYESDGSWAYGF